MPSKKASVSEAQTLMTGLAFGESPRWHDDRLWFSDWGAHEVIAVDLEGKSEVIAPRAVVSVLHRLAARWASAHRLGARRAAPAPGARRVAGDPCRPERPLATTPGTRSSWTAAATPTSTTSASTFPAASSPRDHRPGHPGRLGSAGGRWRRLPQRHGRDARQRDADRRRVLRQQAHGLRHRGRRQPVEPAGVGRPRRRRPRRHLPRRRRRRLVRRTSPTSAACAFAKAARCCRRSTSTAAASPACSAARTGRTLFMVGDRVARPENMAGGARTGQVLTAEAPAPGAGWP